jgi:hypothetical protein
MMTAKLELDRMVVSTHGPFELRTDSVRVTRAATFEEWEAAITWAQQAERASPWWVADLLAIGESSYGDMYTQAIETTGLRYGTLANYVSVARSVEMSRRRELLSFSHHQEVAALAVAEQDYWLDCAETDQLSVKELRRRIQDTKAKPAPASIEYWVYACCWSVEDQQRLAAQLRAEGFEVHVGGKF